jgi:hypothetical protein
MSEKLKLYKVKGDENTVDEQFMRTCCAKNIYEKYYIPDRTIKTWKTKGEPKSSWYPETPWQHVYGVKK